MIDLKTIDKSKFKLGKVGRGVKLLYDKNPVQICTSTLYSPFGAKPIIKEWSNFTEYNLDCSLNQSNSENSVAFRESIETLDNIIKELVQNNLPLFNVQNENSDFIYSSILRENGNYPKLMKLNLSRDKNGNFESFIFDIKKEKILLNESIVEEVLSRGKVFKSIIECVKVWHYNGKVGTIWKVVQLKFSEKEPESSEQNESTFDSSKVYNQLMIEDDD
jgi:hypothetical protein